MSNQVAPPTLWSGWLEEASDAGLLAHFRDRSSEHAFAEIVRRHGPMVLRTCVRLLGPTGEAEDAAQAAFVLLTQRCHAIHSALPIWLHWAARNTAFKMLRSRCRRAFHEREAAKLRIMVEQTGSTVHLREELDAALAQMPAALRQAVILRYLEGYSQQEAARLASCPQGTLARRAGEGLERLRKILRTRGVLLPATLLVAWLNQEAIQAAALSPDLMRKLAAARAAPSPIAVAVSESVLDTLRRGRGLWCTGIAALLAVVILTGTVGLRWAGIGGAARREGSPAVQDALRAEPAVPPPLFLLPGEQPLPSEPSTQALNLQILGSRREAAWVKLMERIEERGLPRKFSRSPRAVAVSPDGQTLAMSHADGRVQLWDRSTGQERTTLLGGSARVWSLAFSPNGKLLAAGSDDHLIRVWNLATAAEPLSLRGHQGGVLGLAFSPDGRALASASADGSVWLWDVAAGRLARTVIHSSDVIFTSVAFSPQGRQLAAGSLTGDLHIWDADTMQERKRWTKSWVSALAFLDENRDLVTAGVDGLTIRWDSESGNSQELHRGLAAWSVEAARDESAWLLAGGGCIVRWPVRQPGFATQR